MKNNFKNINCKDKGCKIDMFFSIASIVIGLVLCWLGGSLINLGTRIWPY